MGLRPVELLEEGVDCVVRLGEQADSSLVARRVGTMTSVTADWKERPTDASPLSWPSSLRSLRGRSSCNGYRLPASPPLSWCRATSVWMRSWSPIHFSVLVLGYTPYDETTRPTVGTPDQCRRPVLACTNPDVAETNGIPALTTLIAAPNVE
ncbi:MAG: bacterial regulatory helix-turn-helix, lysR family protein [Gammaproteobacteria bacterium]|nr:bacterial regulatory helix-turn-helix, lysR family protein [Gammaproteobacteria bacterium]